ncbi:hypothetical protein M8C21_004332 [Ambrosia artemisiifolia]|uniref:Uncharacterized protein n=1 Tax=Ambrosia artemisiifolia TaxID=4212 RepID=A0AAD5BT88_AMBAR|nr:hypothetical protein M8C21_004332 [Ambrosia artemisiifolia]
MSAREDSDSDAPEEFTAQQAIQKDEEITTIQKQNKARTLMLANITVGVRSSIGRLIFYIYEDVKVVIGSGVAREVKERRRKWAEKLTPRQPRLNKNVPDEEETETPSNKGMLPDDIVKLLAANEKKVFSSDSEEEKSEKKPRKKKSKRSGMEPVILKELPPPPCLQKSLEFLKKRKMQVPRSSAVLDNSNQALRFLSSSALMML